MKLNVDITLQLIIDSIGRMSVEICLPGRREGRKEGNVLFNHALNTFCLQLYGIIHIVKDNSDSEKRNPLPPISSKGSFICIIPQTGYHIQQPLLHQSWSTGWNEK